MNVNSTVWAYRNFFSLVPTKMDIPTIFLALKDMDTPITAKIFASITVVYALSPIDLVPDFIPVLGYLDDVILLPMLVTLTIF